MYNTIDTTTIKPKQTITKDYLLSKVTDYDIFRRYIGEFQVGGIYNSPLRKDKNPSFGVFYSRKHGKLLFKDHGTGETGDAFVLAKLVTGETNYNNLLTRIASDLQVTNNTKLRKKQQYQKSDKTIIGIVRQPFTQVDIDYWDKYHISTKTLKKYNVNSIKYYLCDGIVKAIYKYDNPMYAYKVYNNFKIYRPLGDKFTKWRNNLTEFDIQGYEQLPENGNLLIITKSLKDVMVLSEMGYDAIAPSSESTFISEKALKVLLKRFKTLLINFDRDTSGVKQLRKITLKTGLNGFLVPKKFGAKDISDAVVNTSFREVKTWLKKELKNYEPI